MQCLSVCVYVCVYYELLPICKKKNKILSFGRKKGMQLEAIVLSEVNQY